MMKRFFLALSLCLTALSGFATDYYCSPSGTGDGSSYQKPGDFTTLLNALKPGDVLFCLEGQYNYTNTISITLCGTADKPITICRAPGEYPVFDFRKQAYGKRGFQIQVGANYLHFKGLTVRYTGKNAIHNSGSYNTFEDLDVYGNGDTGIQMKAGGNNLILNCDSHDNFDDMLSGDFGGNADGFADKQYTGGGNIYRGCRAWNNSDDGWDFYQRVSQSGTMTIMENCVCYKNGPAYYDMRNHPRYETDKSWFDQFINGKSVEQRNHGTVYVTLDHYYNNGNGNGFKLGGGYTKNVVRAAYCLAVANTVKGFDQNNNDGTMEIYNCTAWNNGQDYGFYNTDNGQVTAKNNISLGNSYIFARPNAVNVNNSWNIVGITCDESDFQSLDDSQILVVRLDDGSLPETTFMRLVEGSDLIDRGLDLGLGYPFSGTAPDLGCFEYVAPTAIRQLPASGNASSPVIYHDLQGRKVHNPTHGLYIVNGHKLVVL